MDKFLDSKENLITWVELAEAYWSQFYWSPYHYTKRDNYTELVEERPKPQKVINIKFEAQANQ